MGAPDAIRELVRRFEEHREAYQSGRYNETQLRREFLDPFFEALGWDVNNRQSHAEAYKEVIHEDAVKVGGLTKAPDYSFRIGGARKFFVEAKKPSASIKNDPGPAFQLRRYAWSAKLPLSILTDFDEFAVYDCRRRPDKTDKSSLGRVIYLTCAEYETRWEEIAGIFSKEAILKGSFDRFAAAGAGAKRGTAGVDAAFLAEIEGWRDLLARSIALRNPDLSVEALNFAVQRLIADTDRRSDRLVSDLCGLTEEETAIVEHTGAVGNMARKPMRAYHFSEYFDKEVLRKRTYLRKEWCTQVIENPLRSEPQEYNRIRHWGAIEELEGRF